MIRILHDGQTTTLDPKAAASLRDLVRRCAQSGDDQPRVIVRLEVNHQVISPDDLDRLDEFSSDEALDILIETRRASEVAFESLESSATYAGAVESALQQTALLLRAGQIEQGNRLFADALDGLSVLIFAVCSAAKILEFDADLLRGLEPQVRPWLRVLSEAQQDRDWIRVADYLEYELGPRLAEWPERIRTAQNRLRVSMQPVGAD